VERRRHDPWRPRPPRQDRNRRAGHPERNANVSRLRHRAPRYIARRPQEIRRPTATSRTDPLVFGVLVVPTPVGAASCRTEPRLPRRCDARSERAGARRSASRALTIDSEWCRAQGPRAGQFQATPSLRLLPVVRCGSITSKPCRGTEVDNLSRHVEQAACQTDGCRSGRCPDAGPGDPEAARPPPSTALRTRFRDATRRSHRRTHAPARPRPAQ